MPRFYLPALPESGEIFLSDKVLRHIHVLRLRVGDALVLFDGAGNAVSAELVSLDKRRAVCRIIGRADGAAESPLNIMLIQAVSAGERMEFTLQKSVELGVNAIQPVISRRSVVRLSGERADKRQARWQEIVVSACEQCGRNTVPPVLPVLELADYWRNAAPVPHLMMSLNQARSLKDLDAPQSLALLVGCEGGWTAEEEAAARAHGCQAFTLGGRVLRTETAALAAVAAMQTLWGDFV
ncbi:16S rRNA (uracil(1498)-N(3))-methyltransferase [Conchiformibius kuhniae]|uniref:Ribosomal RNA small subunit methyltransferase E n=1 Tax=Conchiformibius kuhniae TaxID=211502 RepID=A0ABD8B7C4_9NEIS|nr:16S rRNA (uracil(1498)-N(3))-methyltransferase [Conchiformibius kuhniae]